MASSRQAANQQARCKTESVQSARAGRFFASGPSSNLLLLWYSGHFQNWGESFWVDGVDSSITLGIGVEVDEHPEYLCLRAPFFVCYAPEHISILWLKAEGCAIYSW